LQGIKAVKRKVKEINLVRKEILMRDLRKVKNQIKVGQRNIPQRCQITRVHFKLQVLKRVLSL
jgi:hypothetical protein